MSEQEHVEDIVDLAIEISRLDGRIRKLKAALQEVIERYRSAEEGWPMEDMVAIAKNAIVQDQAMERGENVEWR
jgi:hypothetical protein